MLAVLTDARQAAPGRRACHGEPLVPVPQYPHGTVSTLGSECPLGSLLMSFTPQQAGELWDEAGGMGYRSLDRLLLAK